MMLEREKRECPVCHKRFFVPYVPNWKYRVNCKDNVITVCSWNCYRALNKELFGDADGKKKEYKYKYHKKEGN